MKTEIAKIKFRRGSESERKNVIFDEGEPAYTVDSKRIYVGDGTTNGGNPIPYHWVANSADQITNPQPNDLALIGGTLWWYNQDFWQNVGGDNGGIGLPDDQVFETKLLSTGDGITYPAFSLKFEENGPLSAGGDDHTGIYLNYSNNFTSYPATSGDKVGVLEIPFFTPLTGSGGKINSIDTKGPIGLQYVISECMSGSSLLTSSGSSFYGPNQIIPIPNRKEGWKYMTIFTDNTLTITDGTVQSMVTVICSSLPSTIQNSLKAKGVKPNDNVHMWYPKKVKVLSVKK